MHIAGWIGLGIVIGVALAVVFTIVFPAKWTKLARESAEELQKHGIDVATEAAALRAQVARISNLSDQLEAKLKDAAKFIEAAKALAGK